MIQKDGRTGRTRISKKTAVVLTGLSQYKRIAWVTSARIVDAFSAKKISKFNMQKMAKKEAYAIVASEPSAIIYMLNRSCFTDQMYQEAIASEAGKKPERPRRALAHK